MNCSYQALPGNILSLDCPRQIVDQTAGGGFFDLVVTVAEWGILAVLALIFLNSSAYIVKQQSRAIVERLGKYHRTAGPGFHLRIPVLDRIVARRWLRIEQLALQVQTKTKDNVFVTVHVAVQKRIIAEKAADSWYQLENEEQQISAYVFDVVRAQIPLMELDHTFERKDDVAKAIIDMLKENMEKFGYEIVAALVTDIDPDPQVKAAMNEIQAQTRLQEAAKAKGEANKILVVKNAEAEAESKKLQGEGIANQRTAIAKGLKDSVDMIKDAAGVDAKEVLQTLLLTQYFDTIKEVGTAEGARVIFLPHSPGGMNDIAGQIRDGMLAADQGGK